MAELVGVKMLGLEFNFINGLMFGLAHVPGDEDDDFDFCVPVGIGFIQVIFYKFKTTE